MYTFIETPTFVAEADKLWKEGERLEFFEWLASNPEMGDVVPGIYFLRLASGEIWLLLVYPKSVRDNIPGHLLKAVREEIENG